ncbi:MAG: protein-disulfide isomerase [Robiginitomaculum sp.]|nr:MAG: protein-disulfide isomerase [Robiginitomaculum sp.]PHQ68225.1 MAG: protein-disulfide isomerase [Robiginitomaculum sp.]
MLGTGKRDNFMRKILMITLASMMFSGCAYAQEGHADKSTDAKPHIQANAAYKLYDADANSMVDIDKAMARARIRGTKVMIVMGANWCHDSRGFAARLDQPKFQTLVADNYEVVYVSAGTDSGQKDQNRDVSKRFGVDAIVGTPTVFIAAADGTVLNADSAGYWRNAESIPADMSYAYLDMYAKNKVSTPSK